MPEIRLVRDTPEEVSCDLLALPVYTDGKLPSGTRQLARDLGLDVGDLLRRNGMTGALGDALPLPGHDGLAAGGLLLVGLGDRAKANPRAARKAGAVVARRAGRATRIATTIPHAVIASDRSAKDPPGWKRERACAAFAEGFLLGAYRFDRYKSAEPPPPIEELLLLARAGWEARAVNRGIEWARAVAGGTVLARDLTNTPASDKSPASFAAEAKRLASEHGLKLTVLTEKELKAGGYGGLLGVGQGAPAKPPRLIALSYEPRGAKTKVALVGKGITFDSGGINLKTQQLDWMKMDMGGAGVVFGAMLALANLKPKVAVTGIICSAENMPSGDALRPGDVITIRGGKTVEIGNTDAEGRLVMADGIVYAREHGADIIADVATLTGAIVVALGKRVFGVFGDPRTEVRKVIAAAEQAGEAAWEMPLVSAYRPLIDSDIADVRNISRGDAGGGAITAALFLKEFAGDTPWLHLDIAGATKSDSEEFEIPKGATGVGVRTLVEWIMAMQ